MSKKGNPVPRKLAVLAAMMALALAAAVPAFAQEETRASATGVIFPGLPADVGGFGTHSIEDEATGTLYALRSAGPDLDSYGSQRVTVHGALTPGEEGTGEGEFGGNGTLPSIDVTRVEPGGPGGPPPGPSTERSATFAFELAVECDPPADATFFGQVPAESLGPVRLDDPDGDGLYTGSITVPRFAPGPTPPGTEPVSLPVRIVQGPPTRVTALGPEFRVIKDFGAVKAEDGTFEASVSFCDDDGGSDDGGNGSDGGGIVSGDMGAGGSSSGSSSSSSASASGSATGGGGSGAKVLPATGGSTLLALGAGALLVGGGILARRIAR